MTWQAIHAARGWGRWPAEDVVRLVSRLRGRGEKLDCALDIGCGGGAQLIFFAAEGMSATGVDVALTALERAEANLARLGLAARLVTADARSLPFADESFDLVSDVDSLCYLTNGDMYTSWREVARVLRPDGVFISVTFTSRCYTGLHDGDQGGAVEPLDGPLAGMGPTQLLAFDDLQALANDAGLQVAEVQSRSRTFGERRDLIEEWVVLLRKPTP